MRNMIRVLRYSWRYRFRLILSVVCAVAVALLWSANLSAILPVLTVLSENQNVQTWLAIEAEKLEKVLVDFIDLKYDVLVCTNIIESGLDISNANTIII